MAVLPKKMMTHFFMVSQDYVDRINHAGRMGFITEASARTVALKAPNNLYATREEYRLVLENGKIVKDDPFGPRFAFIDLVTCYGAYVQTCRQAFFELGGYEQMNAENGAAANFQEDEGHPALIFNIDPGFLLEPSYSRVPQISRKGPSLS